ncbi:transmembrane protease serine 2-like [Thalassophryne amazonica]|uniref:transmembrane protease serine 2-like n=1 Tax=Thalassophryne amazonica TaxID=390379 RepID=UPI001471D009|nr:transmembrane protease serine 2-like [Thalassophryne amazonica]
MITNPKCLTSYTLFKITFNVFVLPKLASSFSLLLSFLHSQYLDSGLYFTHEEGDERRPHPFSLSDVQPQYVHHLTPKSDPLPPHEIKDSVPKSKGVKQRCVKFMVPAVINMLLLLLLAGILLGYYFSSPCTRRLQCGDGSCVWESQWCDGRTDCPTGQDEANCVRLYGSDFLLQISSRSKNWRTVCSHGWTDQQGAAVCQQFGYSRSTYFKSGQLNTDPDHKFFMVKPDFRPEVPLLQQFVLSSSCPNNSVVTLRCIDCGNSVNSSQAPDSQPVSPGVWPWQVSLQVRGSHRCGGAMITPYWIVTAAHCVSRNSDPKDWMVYAEMVTPSQTLFNPAHSVSRIIAHEGYSSLTYSNDIALMKLSHPLDISASRNIGPVCLPNIGLNITVNHKCWTTGFVSTVNGEGPRLMETPVSLIDRVDCNNLAAYKGRVLRDMMCATNTHTGAHKCHSDSDGPLVAQKGGLWRLLGVTVSGGQCTEPNKPSVYSNTTYFLEWIYHQMRVGADRLL